MIKTLYQVKYSFVGSSYKVYCAYPTEEKAKSVKAKIEAKHPSYKVIVEPIHVLDYQKSWADGKVKN